MQWVVSNQSLANIQTLKQFARLCQECSHLVSPVRGLYNPVSQPVNYSLQKNQGSSAFLLHSLWNRSIVSQLGDDALIERKKSDMFEKNWVSFKRRHRLSGVSVKPAHILLWRRNDELKHWWCSQSQTLGLVLSFTITLSGRMSPKRSPSQISKHFSIKSLS